jgi:hypothetical protein
MRDAESRVQTADQRMHQGPGFAEAESTRERSFGAPIPEFCRLILGQARDK